MKLTKLRQMMEEYGVGITELAKEMDVDKSAVNQSKNIRGIKRDDTAGKYARAMTKICGLYIAPRDLKED